MRRIAIFLLFGLLIFAEKIEKIEIVGNKKISDDTIKYYLTIAEGEEYREDILPRELQALWNTGFFEDIRILVADGRKGKIIRIEVKERPIIKEVKVVTDKYVKPKDVEERLREKGAEIIPYSYYNPKKVANAKKVIEEFLQEKGYALGEVNVEEKRDAEEVSIVFHVKGKGKLKIAKIEIVGNQIVPDEVLIRGIKSLKTLNPITYFSSKSNYSLENLKKAKEELREKYLNLGFLDVDVKDARIEVVEGKAFPFFGQKKKMLKVVFEVDEGNLYRIGKIKIEGNKAIPTRILRSLLLIKENQIYSLEKRNESIKNIQEIYGIKGYFYAQIYPIEDPKPEEKIVNITIKIQENKRVRLRYLEFKGNTYTNDKVLRREFLIREGDYFNIKAFENSIRRIRQLGIVEIKEMPEVKPAGDDEIDLVVKVEEMHRNQIMFQGGYSGYEGYFVGFSLSTVNFMGKGESVSLFLQYGSRFKSYSIGFTEPYIFDKPMVLGFDVHDTLLVYPYMFTRRSKGGSINFGWRWKTFWHFNIAYSNENVSITDVNEDYIKHFPWYFQYFWLGTRKIAAISPTIYRSTVDSPLFPTTGTMYMYRLKFAADFLGGEVNFIKHVAEFVHYHRFRWGHILGMRFQLQYMKALKESTIPIYERIFLGGERSLRGFDIYRVSPTTPEGYRIGGTKSILFNLEYEIRMKESPLSIVFFFDAGNAFAEDQNLSVKDLYYCMGVEGRVFVEMFRMPFRLIFSYNPKIPYPTERTFAIRFGVGRTF